MKRIKLLSLILAILMLAGTAVLFSSCAKTEPGVITPSEDTVDVDLSDYVVLYGESQSGSNFTRAVRDQFDSFVAKLNAATGASLKLKQASRVDMEEGAKEILIGATDREESVKALEKISGDGFVIEVLENKIVIVGTSNLYTATAVDYFVENYIKGKEGAKKLTVHESVRANEMESIVLADSTYEAANIPDAYTYVYKNGLGMIPNAYLTLTTDVSVPNYKEYPMIAADALAQDMASIAKLSMKHFPVGNDATTTEKEVLIGLTTREESKAALAEIDETQYIIAVKGERVVINAWSNAVLAQATATYKELLKEATVKDEAGNTKVCLPRHFHFIGDAEHNWVTNFPKPEGEGIELVNTMDNNDNSLQYLYRGTGVTKTAYDAYCAALKKAGYAAVQTSEAEGSAFAFFKNERENIALYVAFNAYTHKDEFSEYDWTISKIVDNKVIRPYGFETGIRIISSTIENAFLPDASMMAAPDYSYEFKTQTSITSTPLYSLAVGHCYIIALEDGSLIVYDGGNVNADGSGEQHRLWDVLCELNERITGKPTATDNKVHIAAWVLSHAHGDHFRAFWEMLKAYGKSGKLKMDYMIANIPSWEAYSSESFEEVGEVMPPDTIKRMQGLVTGGFQLIKPHTGMKFHLANVEFQVMTTWEDLNPWQTPNTNDTNTVLKLTIGSRNSDEKTTLMWLGDANRLQSRFMCATYGTTLKVDMSSVAHHGNAGCEVDLYEMLDPETIFWTHQAGVVQSYINPASKRWMDQVDQYFTYELASVKRIFANGEQLFYASGSGSDAEQIATGIRPAANGYMHLKFVDGVADFDDVRELHFDYGNAQVNGRWILQEVTETALAHTDISGGADAFQKNQNVMTFASNYMVKCAQGCPTGAHTH